MGKLLRISDYLLLTLALASDAFMEIRSGFGAMPLALDMMYGYSHARNKKNSYKSTVSRMLSTGDINKKVDSNGKVILEITPSGISNFKRRFPMLSLKSKKWDNSFMVVIFDIPEVERKDRYAIRKKLEALGFAMLQESVWVSPYHFEEDLREFFVNNELTDKVFVLNAKNIYAGNINEMVKKIWKLEILNNNYERIFTLCRKFSNIQDKNNHDEVRNIMNLYLSILKSDPMLPEEIDFSKSYRDRASGALKSILNG
jgi:CRISPR-associated endonuclease Cas2